MTWPATDAPATAPTDHGEVRTQAYYAGGGDYFRSGYYSIGMFASGNWATLAGGLAGRMHLRPFIVPVRRSFDRIGVNLTTGNTAAAGGLIRFGIYTGAGTPTTLLADYGTVSSEGSGAKEITISQSLDPGVYWLAAAFQVSVAGPVAMSATPAGVDVPWFSSSTSPLTSSTGRGGGWFVSSGVTGALPSSITPTANDTASIPAIGLRAS